MDLSFIQLGEKPESPFFRLCSRNVSFPALVLKFPGQIVSVDLIVDVLIPEIYSGQFMSSG
jgi:hypothetical protein